MTHDNSEVRVTVADALLGLIETVDRHLPKALDPGITELVLSWREARHPASRERRVQAYRSSWFCRGLSNRRFEYRKRQESEGKDTQGDQYIAEASDGVFQLHEAPGICQRVPTVVTEVCHGLSAIKIGDVHLRPERQI